MKIKIIILFYLLLQLPAYSFDYKFKNINDEFGVSIRETGKICKDKNGFIWTASKVGAIRVSEGDCRTYQFPYKTADIITVKMITDGDFVFGVSNNGQIFRYNEVLDKFEFRTDLRVRLHSEHLIVNDIRMLGNDVCLLATSGGLFCVTNRSVASFGLKDVECKSITEFDASHYVCVQKGVVFTVNKSTFKTKVVAKSNALSALNITKLFYVKRTRALWIGTSTEGIFVYHFAQHALRPCFSPELPHQPILAITSAPGNNVFVGIDGQGMWELSDDGTKVLNVFKDNVDNPMSLRGDGIYDIFCDSKARVWISTYTGGLSYVDLKFPLVNIITHRINVANSLCDNNVNKILEDQKGRVWFATDNGLSCWNRVSNEWHTFYQNKQGQAKVFLALAEDLKGNIWAGTYASGIYVVDGATGRELMHFSKGSENSQFSVNFIFDLFKDRDGDVWIGGIQSDLASYNSTQNKLKFYGQAPIKALAELRPGMMLLGCSYGLLLLDKKTERQEVLIQGYTIQDIYVRGDDIWLATSGDGILHYDFKTRHLRKINSTDGLISNYVNSITFFKDYFWVGTENGICRFKPQSNGKFCFETFYSMSNLSFNVGATTSLTNGNLIFGSSRGAVEFNPTKIEATSLEGRIYLQDIKVSGRSVRNIRESELKTPLNSLNELILSHDENNLDIEILTVGNNSKGAKFTWIMQGLENKWSNLSDRRIITYTNLPSGYFKLRVKMYDSSLSHLLDEKVILFYIVPPFWASWWFRMIAVLLIIALVYLVLKNYTTKLKRLHTEDKIRFFTTTAHDIRTSLTLIQAPIEELNKERNLSEKGRYFLDLATEQSGRLSFVATQLLDFEKVDVGKGQLFEVMADITALVRRRVAMFEAAARKNRVKLIFTTGLDSYSTALDELKIEKVIDNLISNAIKYSHPDSTVEINLYADALQWTLEVIDHGLGISEKARKNLFREFYRGDNPVNSKIVGSGIGLLLVKNYVNMHSGSVKLQSAENEGSIFSIHIPYKQIQTVLSTDDELITADNRTIFNDVGLLATVQDTTETVNDKKLHVFIVEDNDDLRNFIKCTFEPEYKVTTADNGKSAWDAILKKMPDLVISDIMMPDMDGFELCKRIKSTFDTSHIPVVLLTALTDVSQQLEGLKLGADDYITKPFDIALLKQRINSIVKNREIVKEKALKIIRTSAHEEPVLNNEQNDIFVRRSVQVVKDNIANCEFGKDEFAAAMNVSSSLLYKKVKALTGQSPVDFIKLIRLDFSIELLQSKKYTVTEVSELCGFSSVGYFSTVFKKHFGKSPTDL